jgi:hypothetical protein
MSNSVLSVGIMVPLNRRITDKEYEEWSEILWDQGQVSNVYFNYEGTLAYTDIQEEDEYGIHFGEITEFDPAAFDCLNQFGLRISHEQARSYRCYWYNGSDSDMSTITLKEFMKITNQNLKEIIDYTTVLSLPMQKNDANAETIGDYLNSLLSAVWGEEESFSGKRPFGNSGWKHEIYYTLVKEKIIEGSIDLEYGDLTDYDEVAANKVINEAIQSLLKGK